MYGRNNTTIYQAQFILGDKSLQNQYGNILSINTSYKVYSGTDFSEQP